MLRAYLDYRKQLSRCTLKQQLNSQKIGDDGVSALLPGLKTLKRLRKAEFLWNEFTSDACERIIRTMTNSTELSELLLYANAVENDEASVGRLRKLFVELYPKTASLLISDFPE